MNTDTPIPAEPQPPIVFREPPTPDTAQHAGESRLDLPDLLARLETVARAQVSGAESTSGTAQKYKRVARLAAELRVALDDIEDTKKPRGKRT